MFILRRNRRGNYSIIMVFLLIVIMGLGALSADYSYISLSRTQIEAVTDAASHAAILEYRSNGMSQSAAENAAAWIAASNDVGLSGGRATVKRVQIGQYFPSTGNFNPGGVPTAARVTLERAGGNALPLLVWPMLGGTTEVDLGHTSTTAAHSKEIVTVLDKSCSMGWNNNAGRRGVDNALEGFSEYIWDNRLPGDKMGAVWYSSGANWWTSSSSGTGWSNGMADLMPPSGSGVSEASFLNKFKSWDSERMSGGTNHYQGLKKAIDYLISPAADPYAFKAIILITDGCGNFGSEPARAAANNISIWVVGFGGVCTSQLPLGVTGYGYDVALPNGNQLDEVLVNIGESMPVTTVD